MPIMRSRPSVCLYVNSESGDDRRAKSFLKEAKIPFDAYGPTSKKTPLVKWGYLKFEGLKEIKGFVAAWKANQLPDPWCGLADG